MSHKKYKLTNETRIVNGHTLHRIERVRKILGLFYIGTGIKGGWVESEDNLSHYGNCWVYGDACVYENAYVSDDATIDNNAMIYGCACVSGNVRVYDNAEIYENARVWDYVIVQNNAKIYGDSVVACDKVRDNAVICGDVSITNPDVKITHDTIIREQTDIYIFNNNWSSGRTFIYTKSNNMWSVGCFYGTGEQLIKKAYEDNEDKGKHYEAYVKFVEHLNNINKNK